MAASTAKRLEQDNSADGSAGGGKGQQEILRAKVEAIIGRLQAEADKRVGERDLVEKRWLDDLRQYHGRYEGKIDQDLKQAEKSTLFINATRAKTNACEARLADMLFPTDDKNWGIQPTPVPELTVQSEQAAIQAAEAKKAAAQAPEDPVAGARAHEAEQGAAMLQAQMDEARRRCRSMEEEIDDHLRECDYAIQARDVIHDACKLGTGIMKGPVTGGRTRASWRKAQQGGNLYQMTRVSDPRPAFWRVDPWSIFPQSDARTVADNESWFERHLKNKKGLRRLARQPGFDQEAIRRLLRDEARSSAPTYLADLRGLTGAFHDAMTDHYHVWEYHGPLEAEEARDLALAMGGQEMLDDLDDGEAEADPLEEMQVTIWFCQGEMLKFGIHHLDSGDSIYSFYCLEKDEAGLFGFGIPYIMRDSQSALNAAWRTMLDNAGLSSGPQIIIHEDGIEPVNGVWGLQPRKLWRRKAGSPINIPAFESYDIPMHQAELAGIIDLARRNIDEETNISVLAQGEQGSHVTQTAHGMSILMNAVNVVFRRIVKNFDDDMTTPNIRRIYDFLMQFSDKEHIKGDFEVDARGTSVLLVREIQAQNLMMFLQAFPGHPVLGRFIKQDGLPGLRRLVQTMMIAADELVKTDEEVADDEARAAAEPPPPNPEIMKIEADLNRAALEIEGKERLAMITRETELMILAGKMNLTVEQLRAKLAGQKLDADTKERIMATEIAVTERRDRRHAEQAAAEGEPPSTAGGYI